MYRTVIVEKWAAHLEDVHVREPGFSGIHSHSGSVVSDATPKDVCRIGKISGKMKDYRLNGSCEDFCRIAEDVLAGVRRVPEILQQLNAAGVDDLDTLSGLELSYLDWAARELWIEEARCVEDPWADKITIGASAIEMVEKYLKQREGGCP